MSPHTTYRTNWNSPVGPLLLSATDDALCGVWFGDQKGIPAWAEASPVQPQQRWLTEAISQLQDYFGARRRHFDLPLDLSQGTAFQQDVWRALAAIPYGQTVSYQHLSQAIGRPQAVRALGGAVGRNPLGIILPCHRVVGANGHLTGYTGGLERKVALLQLEGALF